MLIMFAPRRWEGDAWGPCSVSCGVGTQERRVLCRQVVSSTYTMVVQLGACLEEHNVPTTQVMSVERAHTGDVCREVQAGGECREVQAGGECREVWAGGECREVQAGDVCRVISR